MPLKAEKLEQEIKKILNQNTDLSQLTLRSVKRSIEDSLGLETGDLDSQHAAVRDILGRLVQEAEGEKSQDKEEEEDNSTETTSAATSTSTSTSTTSASSSSKRRKQDEGDAEDGEDNDEAEADEDIKPAKKAKHTTTTTTTTTSSSKKSGASVAKKNTGTSNNTNKTNKEGETYFELNEYKRVTIRNWRNETYVDLRTFYSKDGELAPTPKGTMLSQAQWNKLKEAVGKIDELIGSM